MQTPLTPRARILASAPAALVIGRTTNSETKIETVTVIQDCGPGAPSAAGTADGVLPQSTKDNIQVQDQLGFPGMVISDWGTVNGSSIWGVESLTPPQRAALFLQAGQLRSV